MSKKVICSVSNLFNLPSIFFVMDVIFCYFCEKGGHVSEYCHDYPTLRSRYSLIFNRRQKACLCQRYEPISEENDMCKCKIICKVCFQHHHFAMCPKRDPEHPSNPILIPEPFCLFSHPSHFAQRFFELCNPVNQNKLQKTCRHFESLKLDNLKLKLHYDSDKPLPLPNTVLHRFGRFNSINDITQKVIESKCFFNLENIKLENCRITKDDLKLLSVGDPNTLNISNCRMENSMFQEILNAFPYAYIFQIKTNENITKELMLSFMCARKVDWKEITFYGGYLQDLDVEDLVLIFDKYKDLRIKIVALHCNNFAFIDELKKHDKFSDIKSISDPERPGPSQKRGRPRQEFPSGINKLLNSAPVKFLSIVTSTSEAKKVKKVEKYDLCIKFKYPKTENYFNFKR